MLKTIFFSLLLIPFCALGQNLRATVSVRYEKIQSSDNQIYKTLEKSLSDYLNNASFANKAFSPRQRIECNFTLVLTSVSGNKYSGHLIVQARRPVYASNYYTPLLNMQDAAVNFDYRLFDVLSFSPTTVNNEITALMDFYAYLILGLYNDSFALNSGTVYFEKAQRVVQEARAKNYEGWQSENINKSKSTLIDDFTGTTLIPLRKCNYQYHRMGLDFMHKDLDKGKTNIAQGLLLLSDLRQTVGNYGLSLFIDAKTNEIEKIFSDGPPTNSLKEVKDVLNQIAPMRSKQWNTLTR